MLIKSKGKMFKILIDEEDVLILSQNTWYLGVGGKYIVSDIFNPYKRIYIHRFLMNPDKDKLVDHINHDTLDNRRQNLRVCTSSQNQMNRPTPSKGYMWSKKLGKWRSYIQYQRKSIHIGYFSSEVEAAAARAKFEKELFKEFSPNKYQ